MTINPDFLAPCGFYCGVCAIYIAHRDNNRKLKERLTIVYSGDTEWTDTLVKAAAGADLFICEAYFFQKRIRFHLDYQTLAEQRASLQCKRIVLTHMSDDMFQRLSDIQGESAEDGMTIAL